MSRTLTLPNFARSKIKAPDPETTDIKTGDEKVMSPPTPQGVIPTPIIVPRRTPAVAIMPITPRLVPIAPRVTPGVMPRVTPGVTPRLTPMALAPKTPLYMPKIGITKKEETLLQPGENPWLPSKVDGGAEIRITAITPIGTIALVPTCDKRPPPTPRRPPQSPTRHLTLRVIDTTGATRVDPILTAAIYLDCTKPEDQGYNYVAQRMRAIAANTMTLQKQYCTTLCPLINVGGRVSVAIFEEALAIYENNQVYYQDRIDDHTLSIDEIKMGLTELERWFVNIPEPKPVDDVESWREREVQRQTKGFTAYCDPELHKYIRLK